MFVLDSDTATLFFNGSEKVVRRVLAAPEGTIYLPAIVVEERLRGRLSAISALSPARASDQAKVPLAYARLLETVRDLRRFEHLPYTAEMEALYQSWPAAVKRVGTRDCRIAATAIVLGFIVITGNLGHYQPIPNTQADDWSR